MNVIEKAVLSHEYSTKALRKQRVICRRTKNRRIRNKAFNKLFWAFMSESRATIRCEVVEHNGRLVAEMKSIIEDGGDAE